MFWQTDTPFFYYTYFIVSLYTTHDSSTPIFEQTQELYTTQARRKVKKIKGVSSNVVGIICPRLE